MLVYHCHKPVFTPKIAIFRRVGMREGGLPLPLAFQYLILIIWRPSELSLVMISSLASKCQHFKLRGLQFHLVKWLKIGHFNFKVLAFEASEDIATKFKSQGLYIIKIKYWNASGSGFLPSLIPALQNIGNLNHKKAKLPKHLQQSVLWSSCG